MSAYKAAVLQCDGCDRIYGREDYATLEGIRARAKARGWLTRVLIGMKQDVTVRIAADFCPRCVRGRTRGKGAKANG